MTPKDAAQILPFSLNTIRELCASGELPARKVGRRWLIPRTLLINYLHNTSGKDDR
ncbi:MAG: helix-turn-helix domain-containing protein [Coriobacteriia bacterium]|nr:helix-turn-helix domain-containing protein [Coriobacteriia bacterium]